MYAGVQVITVRYLENTCHTRAP